MNTDRLYTEDVVLVDEWLYLDSRTEVNHLLVPDAKAELLIPLNEPLIVKNIGSMRGIKMSPGECFFLMPRRRGATLEMSLNSSVLIVKLNALFANKIASCLNEVASGIFFSNRLADLAPQLMDAYRINDPFYASQLIESIFGAEGLPECNDVIQEAVSWIQETKGITSIKEIYSRLHVSKSMLEQHFNREVGLTPKEFCRIEKLNNFIAAYSQDTSQSLTELTYQCGYYDQSHLIKDFRYFLNDSPKKFLSRRIMDQ